MSTPRLTATHKTLSALMLRPWAIRFLPRMDLRHFDILVSDTLHSLVGDLTGAHREVGRGDYID